ncbi:hypothetical protein [Streptomyces sp. B1I3]|uniref:hypothetical protein n=1 Tax=Streptomyces sp. B1I3 TaxID=3042264 RepID=UPI003590067E
MHSRCCAPISAAIGALALAVTTEFYERLPAIARDVEELGLSPLASVAELLTRTALALRDDTVMQAAPDFRSNAH